MVIEVRNGGAPIPEAALGLLFEPFRRGNSARATPERSVGLGLYITRQIVDAHGGTIDLRSTDEDGTIFTVRLPRIAVPAGNGGG
jgi:signal transduction histidine kinase